MPVVTLDLDGETFTIEALANQQIIDLMPETRVPGAKAFPSAIINPRGRVLPWPDIRLAFGMRGSGAAIDRCITVAQVSTEGTHGLVGIRTMRSTNSPPVSTQPTHCLRASSCVGALAVSTVATDEMTHLVHS
ncbi:chemotaxis protein CheW [Rhizobium quercicola]